jgi:hypothetical protein
MEPPRTRDHARRRANSTPGRTRSALRYCAQREHLRRTVKIALVVGLVLTGINEGDVIAAGHTTVATSVKIVLNFCVPFVVSNLGLLAGRR